MLLTSSLNIWFWQRIVSPHMAELAVALARSGAEVTYVAENEMSEDRKHQGWKAPALHNVRRELVNSTEAVAKLVNMAPAESIHICQGVRANGLVGDAQVAISARGLRQWVVMETVDDAGWRGLVKRIAYSHIFRKKQQSLDGILASGHRTADWIAARGVPQNKIFPFAYFLPASLLNNSHVGRTPGPFRFIFAGQLIRRKRVDWLLNTLTGLKNKDFELWIVGAGPEEDVLRELSKNQLAGKVRWIGQLPLPDVPAVLAQADCLVLPSVHDGWGAVASEALMVGTPVICSDACGVAGVVRKAGHGGVFPVENLNSLAALLDDQLAKGPIKAEIRKNISDWAKCLGADAGANYLHQILSFSQHQIGNQPVAPWDGH